MVVDIAGTLETAVALGEWIFGAAIKNLEILSSVR